LLSERERNFLSVVQEPLRVVAEPYAVHAATLGISQEKVLSTLRSFIKKGVIRRIAGIVKHTRVGYSANAMVALSVPEGGEDEAGRVLASFDFVTHCYRRTPRAKWPYSLYAMVHAKNKKDLAAKISIVKKKTGCGKMAVLQSVREFKKTSLRLFT
jgi:DNA-binding Lrp family transcriptional regulator